MFPQRRPYPHNHNRIELAFQRINAQSFRGLFILSDSNKLRANRDRSNHRAIAKEITSKKSEK